jgi:hypothetical protein
MKLGVMPATIGMLLTCKIGFAATDAVTGLKLVEMGVPKVGRVATVSASNSVLVLSFWAFRIRILASFMQKKIKGNIDFNCFVTSFKDLLSLD